MATTTTPPRRTPSLPGFGFSAASAGNKTGGPVVNMIDSHSTKRSQHGPAPHPHAVNTVAIPHPATIGRPADGAMQAKRKRELSAAAGPATTKLNRLGTKLTAACHAATVTPASP